MRKKGKTGVALLMAGVLLFTNSGFVYGTELESPVQLEESELQPEEEGTEEILTEEIEKETEEELEQPEEKEILTDDISLMCFGTVEEVANFAVFLAGDEASFLNGQIITLDGGMI